MAALSGTVVASRLVPSDSLDQYATHDADFGRGGHRSVGNLLERDQIPNPRRKEGMTVWVISESKEYRLVGGITNSHWLEGVAGEPTAPVTANVFNMIAGQDVPGHRAVVMSDVGVVLANNSDILHSNLTLGVSTQSATIGNSIKLQTFGSLTEPSWNWSYDNPIWVGPNGTLTQVPPTTGWLCQIATVINPITIFISPKQPLVL